MVKLRSPRAMMRGLSLAAPLITLLATHAAPARAQASADAANNSPNAPLAVSQVKLTNGLRASKLIGASVYNDGNQQIGTVDDLILSPDAKAVMAVLQVGGFLGVGGKLVAIPYDKLHLENHNQDNKNISKVVMPGASKEELSQLPTFTYGG
jgi:sporulation protein YlmC with PRC-barrel domain